MKFFTPTKLSENISETPEGFLLCLNVPIARTGDMLYAKGEIPIDADVEGKIIISRDADDVFHVDTIASFEGKAITVRHPEDFVDPSNWSYLAKGHLQNVRRGEGEDSDLLLADLLIQDALAISMVKSGLREVSCGYDADYIQIAKGKGRQTNIVGNHLALVEKGRAGPTCAINDHDGGIRMSAKIKEKFKALFNQTVDAATFDEDKPEPKKEDPKEDKPAKDAASYDELVKMMDAMTKKLESMMGSKDEDPKEEKKEPKKEKESEDEEESPGEKSLEDRLKSLEMAVSKLLEKESDEDQSEDEDMEEEESEDDDFEESTMTGDTASRAEILAPGIAQTKDVKVKALKTAYGTKEGKDVIHSLTGNKAPAFDSAEKVDSLFIAASELLKVKRSKALSETKRSKGEDSQTQDNEEDFMTPEKQNAINAAHWAGK